MTINGSNGLIIAFNVYPQTLSFLSAGQDLLLIIPQHVLDADPHDQRHRLDEESRTGTIGITNPRP